MAKNTPASAQRHEVFSSSPSEAMKVRDSEIKALRQIAEKSGDAQTLFILELLETDKNNSTQALVIVLRVSAGYAAVQGLSEMEWVQQSLSRYANDPIALDTLRRTLMVLQENHTLPWPSEPDKTTSICTCQGSTGDAERRPFLIKK